ncbi:MAG: Aminotransferase class-III [Candidatus Magasanikbacteria bacterium GW2011_GWC2_45_8]|uniref:Aminotransferase class-III n=1 Tax=Candidatus Magasanikbacteria bacterium GW2011_GWC2_45_8 TaxID=1619050 RepID=A0A0G1N050_9BACT|nr:MAG: Aminotransferase class-III [Candidatus Magasanikbacteria bacterium GW2011_GWC2_45_8]
MNKKEKYLQEANEYIPSAAQTLSKYPGQYVIGVSPVAIARGKGAYLWDIEGDKYLDMILALGPMVFGYVNERIDRTVKEQIDKGTIYSLPSEHELTLAKLLKEAVPCAEMSRFLMNGNEATTGAVRLARHITKRDHVAKCGYHGFQDWSICTKEGRNTGIPDVLKTLTHDFIYNDINSLEKIFFDYPGQIAAVILEPASAEKPTDNFLEKVKEIAHHHGAILIFDEMVTGFRWSLGGAQEYFGVIPDIACFGKAVSGGYPLSIIAGKAEYMKRMDEIFVSTTFGGFTLGLVAAIETITMMREFGNVHSYMHNLGDYFISSANKISVKYDVPFEFMGFGPHPLMKITIKDDHTNRLLKTFVYQEMNKVGILFSSSILIGYIHQKLEIDWILKELDKIFKIIKEAGDYKNLETFLEGRIVTPRSVRTTP